MFDDGSGPALYAGGRFTSAGGVASTYNIARWDGSNWTALGSGAGNSVFALTVFDDGGGPVLYAGGRFSQAGGVPAYGIAKWDGSIWAPLGNWTSGPNSWVRSLAVFDDGSGPALHAGGSFTPPGFGAGISAGKWDGSNWTTLGSGMSLGAWVYALTVFDDGSGPALFVGGRFTSAGNTAATNFAEWSGSSWTAHGEGLNSAVFALAVFDDGGGPALHVGGAFTSVAGLTTN